jgi:hypothetical protein
MTNPRFKGMKNNPHDKKAKKVLPEPIVKAAKSADAQQWNQGHYNNQICIGLDGVHSNLHASIRGIPTFTQKKIMIDPKLLEIVEITSLLPTSSDFMNKLHSMVWDLGNIECGVSWLNGPRSQFITVETGIALHFQLTTLYCNELHEEIYEASYDEEVAEETILDWRTERTPCSRGCGGVIRRF